MPKIAILGDTHIGMRKDSQKFHKFSEQFYSNVFFPTLKEHNVSTVYQLGDLFDNRKSINPLSLAESRRYFFDPLKNNDITLVTLVGNHDIFWRESLAVNSSSLLLGEYNNIQVIEKPTTFLIGNSVTLDIIPWICKENAQEVSAFIASSKSKLCMGHFEITGFKMYQGVDCESHDGIPQEFFSHYDLVFSGHFHTRSHWRNILYVGTPMEMTWQDHNDQRGFHLYDTDTGAFEFIPNPYTIFAKIQYDDVEGIIPKDLDQYKEKFIKVQVTNKSDLYKFENLLAKLYEVGVYDLKIIEDLTSTSDGVLDEKICLSDTMGLLSNYIDSIEINYKDEVKRYLRQIYTSALNVEVA